VRREPVDQEGFALVEVLVAFAIASVVLATVIGIFSMAVRRSNETDAERLATLLAQSLLARFGADLPLEVGESGGQLADGNRWKAVVRPFGNGDGQARLPIRALDVTVTVTVSGRPSVVLETLKLDTGS
jgi:general secretion pathway protein I